MKRVTYTMDIDITFEYDENNITKEDAMDKIDYFANANVALDDCDINIIGAALYIK